MIISKSLNLISIHIKSNGSQEIRFEELSVNVGIMKMIEQEFTDRLVEYLRENMTSLKGCEIDTKRSVLYNIYFDDNGHLCLNLNDKNEPKHGSGQGFEQDIIIFERKVYI